MPAPIDHVFFIVSPAANSHCFGPGPQPLENQGCANRAERIRTSDLLIPNHGDRRSVPVPQQDQHVENADRAVAVEVCRAGAAGHWAELGQNFGQNLDTHICGNDVPKGPLALPLIDSTSALRWRFGSWAAVSRCVRQAKGLVRGAGRHGLKVCVQVHSSCVHDLFLAQANPALQRWKPQIQKCPSTFCCDHSSLSARPASNSRRSSVNRFGGLRPNG